MFRIYVERKPGFQSEAAGILGEINGFLGISSVTGVRYFNRYDIENTSEDVSKMAALRIFSEPQSDSVAYTELPTDPADTVIIWEYLPGQYDQRSDSAEQCLSLLRESMRSTARLHKDGESLPLAPTASRFPLPLLRGHPVTPRNL